MNFDSQFRHLYTIALRVASDYNLSLDETTNRLFEYYNRDLTIDQAKALFNHPHYWQKTNVNQEDFKDFDQVWLVTGETGHGKTTFVNHVCGRQVGKEGTTSESETSNVEIYCSNGLGLVLIDTPGFFSTCSDVKNRDIMRDITDKVEKTLRTHSQINAIFLIWNPNTLKFKHEKMIGQIARFLGEDSLNSIVFLINKWSDIKNPKIDSIIAEVQAKMSHYFPTIVYDVKKEPREKIQLLKEAAEYIQPYREEYFAQYRKSCYYEKYLQIKAKLQKKKEEEAEKARLEELQNQLKEQQKQQEKIKRENEERRIREEQLEKELEEQKRERREAEERREREEQNKKKKEEQIQRELEEQRRSYEEPQWRVIDSFSPAYYNVVEPDHTGQKFYKGGQFIPGGGHAPASGMWMNPPASSPSTSMHPNPVAGSGTFYKGGQFMPGGGHAPKGGLWIHK